MDNTNNQQQWGKEGAVLVFLHYFGGAASSWQWVGDRLSSDYHCVALNLPGFGGVPALPQPSISTLARSVRKELERLKIDRSTLIGHSMGGKIALQVAADAPEGSIEQVILVAPSPPTVERMPDKEKERMLRHPDRGEAEKTVEKVTLKPLTEEQQTRAVETQLIIDPPTWRWWIQEGMDHSIAKQAAQLDLPITVLASEDDPAITYDMIKNEVMPVLNQATLVTTQQVGHLSPMEVPDWVAGQIRRIVSNGKHDPEDQTNVR